MENEKLNLFERFVFGLICGIGGVFFGMRPIFWRHEWMNGWIWTGIILLFFALGFTWGPHAIRGTYLVLTNRKMD